MAGISRMKVALVLNDSTRILICLFVFASIRVNFVAGKNGQCSLVTIYGLKTADCMNLGLKSLPKYLDGDLKALNFHDNQVSALGADCFHMYPSLQNLYLVRNSLGEIAEDAFRGLQNLQILDLEGNKLNATPGKAFRHISSLRILSLKSNPIQIIRNDHLRFLKNVESLNFENCWLHTIEPHAFAGLGKLYEINLVNNELKGLDADMEDSLAKTVTIVRLHSNPWVCDCRLRWLRKVLQRIPNWDFGTNSPSCSGPDLLKAVSWRHLSPDQFACPSTIVGNSTTSIELKVGSNVSIECIVFGDPEPAITWMKGPKFVSKELIIDESFTPRTSSKEKHIRSVITLRDVTQADASDYKCIAANSAGRSEVTYKVWVVVPETPTFSVVATISLGLEVILGIAIAGVGLVIIFLFCVCCIIARQRGRRRESCKLQKEQNFQKEYAFSGVSKSTETLDVSIQNKEKKETVLVLTSGGEGKLSEKESPVIRQTMISPENRKDDWEEESEQNVVEEEYNKECTKPLRSPEKDKEPEGFTMKIFTVPPAGEEFYDDKSPTSSVRSLGNNVSVVESTDGMEKNPSTVEKSFHTPGTRFKESPPDLLCDRHVMINSSKSKKTDRKESTRRSSHRSLDDEQRDKQEDEPVKPEPKIVGKLSNESPVNSPRSVTPPGKPNSEPTDHTRTLKNPATTGNVLHCDNPVCLKERKFNPGKIIATLPPAVDDSQTSSRKGMSQVMIASSPRNTRARFSTADADAPSRQRDGDRIYTTLRRSPRCQNQPHDIYATLPTKAAHGKRVGFDDFSNSFPNKDQQHQPSATQIRPRQAARTAMARSSLTSDYVSLSSPIANMSAISNRSAEPFRVTSYAIDYLTNHNRPASHADWTEEIQMRATDPHPYNHGSSKLSGSSSTLDIRDVRDTQTPSMFRKAQGCSATSLLDILSPPFGQPAPGSKQKSAGQQQSRKPKPGETDEFGTAV